MIELNNKAFIEESTELLSSLEISLVELESEKDNPELIGQVFRALHTIKGSAGMFGFDSISSFIHDIETVYDYIRNGRLEITKDIIDLTLAARDQISVMLQFPDDPSQNDEELVSRILSGFGSIVEGFKENKKAGEEKTPAAAVRHPGKTQCYKITFAPEEDIYLTGTNPVMLINELLELGEAEVVVNADNIPPFKELNPEKCYVSWEIKLKTDKGINAIEDVFIFINGENAVKIEQVKKEEKHPSGGISIEKHAAAPETQTSIRVSAGKLDELVNLVGELVITQARLSQTASKSQDPGLLSISEDIERLTWSLRDSTLNIRMLPIGTTFSKFIRQVRDLSGELGKEVILTTEGEDTELDKTVIEKLTDPLMHIIRNSIDHGIEDPDAREKAGKPRAGSIHLSASQSGGNVLIKISDDGKGMDKDAIKAKAVAMGLIQENVELSNAEVYSLIFTPGFSTAQKVTNVSGRGVGMDVVKKAIDSLNGLIDVSSEKGTGTTIVFKLPLTLAIIDGLLVKIDEDHFVLPLSTIEECIELNRDDINRTHGRQLLNIRGNIIPYINLRKRFSIQNNIPAIQQVVVANVHNERIGFLVDKVLGQHQTVIKSLGVYYKRVDGVYGATIMGDGTVALILDINKITETEETAEKQLNNFYMEKL